MLSFSGLSWPEHPSLVLHRISKFDDCETGRRSAARTETVKTNKQPTRHKWETRKRLELQHTQLEKQNKSTPILHAVDLRMFHCSTDSGSYPGSNPIHADAR